MSSAQAVYILIFFVHEMSFLLKFYFDQTVIINCIQAFFIAELAERSSQNVAPLLYKIVITHQAEKIWMYDRTTVHGATFNMRGQLYRGHANATALFSSPVVSALGSESDDLGSSPSRGKALCP